MCNFDLTVSPHYLIKLKTKPLPAVRSVEPLAHNFRIQKYSQLVRDFLTVFWQKKSLVWVLQLTLLNVYTGQMCAKKTLLLVEVCFGVKNPADCL